MLQKYSKKQEEQDPQILPPNSGYQLTGSRYIGKETTCLCLAFKGTQKLAGSFINELKIFRLNDSVLHLEQIFRRKFITTLHFSKIKFELFVGFRNGQLEILEMSADEKWTVKCSLDQVHKFYINTLLMNKREDLIITCGNDNKIKFLNYKDNLQIQQVWKVKRALQNGICLNEAENQIIRQSSKQLIISEVGKDGIWRKKQLIIMSGFGSRFCFLGDNQISYQYKNNIVLLQLDQKNDLFYFSDVIQMDDQQGIYQESFKQIFNQKKQILFTRNYKSIILFEKRNNNQLILKQIIKFHNEDVQIAVSDDGQYLAAWHAETQSLQIRKYFDY